MLSETVLALSSWQMTLTSLLHFVFAPLTLGLSLLLAILEVRLILTQDFSLKQTIQFWARIFAIQLILAMSTRVLVLIQYGVSTSFFARFIGDNFAVPIAIESLSSFFLISALFGPFWFGWNQLSDKQHALVTSLISLCLHISALWLISAYAWLDNPGAVSFNALSLRMETEDGWQLLNQPDSGRYILHELGLAYVIAAGFILSICAWYKLGNADHSISQHSQKTAAALGILAILALAGHGQTDEVSLSHRIQQNTLRGIDNHSLLPEIQQHIRTGLGAYSALKAWREDEQNAPLADSFKQQKLDLGYAMLLKRWLSKIETATDTHIRLAAESLLPSHPQLLFWGHKSLMPMGIISLIIFALALLPLPKFNLLVLSAFPISILMTAFDLVIQHCLHQAWLVDGVLPRFLAYSSLSTTELVIGGSFYSLALLGIISLSVFLTLHIIRSKQTCGATS